MMNKVVDTSLWRTFKVGDVFTVDKGKRLTKKDMIPGNTNFIGSSAFNNGKTGTVGNTEHIHPANTISVAYNGSVGSTFFQEEPYWASDDVNVWDIKGEQELTKDIALFLIPIIKQMSKSYSYDRKWDKEAMLSSAITLPIDANGNPDWEYMANAVCNYKKRYIQEQKNNNTNEYKQKIILAGLDDTNIDYNEEEFLELTKATALFRVGDIFKSVLTPSSAYQGTGRKTDQVQDIQDETYSIPLTCAKKGNNGVLHYGKPSDFKAFSNIITVVYDGAVAAGLVYYQPDKVSVFTHSYFITLIDRDLTENLGLYLATVLQNKTYPKYSRENAATWKNKVEEDLIPLPIQDGVDPEHATPDDIDYDYMERYISILKKKKIQQVYDDRCEQLKAMEKM